MILGVKDSKKNLFEEKMKKMAMTEQGSRKQNMATDLAFKFLKILCAVKARYRKVITHARNARKVTIRNELMVATSSFINKI